jgi:ribonuclease HII
MSAHLGHFSQVGHDGQAGQAGHFGAVPAEFAAATASWSRASGSGCAVGPVRSFGVPATRLASAGLTWTVAGGVGLSNISLTVFRPINRPIPTSSNSKSDSISRLIWGGQRFLRMKRIWIDDGCIEVGLDEAGRGPLWGRMYVAAVIMAPEDDVYFDGGAVLRQITDSKKLTARRRAVLRDYIEETAVAKAISWAEPAEIDAVNVLQADMNAMHRALDTIWKDVGVPFQRILVDGTSWRAWCDPESGAEVPAIKIVEGDASVLSIAAASVLAKEAHDEWVRATVEAEPLLSERYGLDRNMGYGTAAHMAGLKTWGAHTLHRRSFAPVRAVVAPETVAPTKGPLFRFSAGGGPGKV